MAVSTTFLSPLLHKWKNGKKMLKDRLYDCHVRTRFLFFFYTQFLFILVFFQHFSGSIFSAQTLGDTNTLNKKDALLNF